MKLQLKASFTRLLPLWPGLGGLMLALALPFVGLDSFYLRIVSFALINLIVVCGLVVLYGYSDQISLASAAFYGIGAYSMAVCTSRFELPVFVGLAVAVGLSALGGLLVALPALRLQSHYLAMGTLAFALLMNWVFTEAETVTGGVNGMMSGLLVANTATPPAPVSSGTLSYLIVLLCAVLTVLITRMLAGGAPGLVMRALGDNDHGARVCGVEVEPVKIRAHIFAAVCAGAGGALYAGVVGYISPSLFGAAVSLSFLAMAVIGGRSSVAGPVLATFLLTGIQYLSLLIPELSERGRSLLQNTETDLYALLIILLVLFAPRGLAGLVRRFRKQ